MTLRSSIYYPGVGTWHSDPHILSWYRNVAPDPYSILVSERDTRSIFYPGTGTWHPIHILSWCRNVTPDPYTILVSERDTPILIILSWCRNVTPDPLLQSWCWNVILWSSSYYPCVGTWHSNQYTILVPERDTRSPNLTTFVHQAFFYTKASLLTK